MNQTGRLGALLTIALCCAPALGAGDNERRATIAAKGRELFRNTTNHCHAYRDLVAFAVTKVDGPGPLLEDLKFVLIGTDLRRRGTGPHYIGNTAGARGDSGFKTELRDGSPQVEHSWAAIYIGKTGPGSGELATLLTEVLGPLLGGKLNKSDALLWTLGADTGQRLDASNFKQLPSVIGRTQCA